jgi:hypothetical protein
MVLPKKPVTLSPEQISELHGKLAEMRHNVNNYLALITAAAEIVLRKPEMAEKLITNLIQQPQKIVEEIRRFSETFEKELDVQRES